jgi:hypothetical protein
MANAVGKRTGREYQNKKLKIIILFSRGGG